MRKLVSFLWIPFAICFALFILVTLKHVFDSADIAAKTAACQSKLHDLSKSLLLYTEAYDQRFPNAVDMPSHRAQLSPFLHLATDFAHVDKTSSEPVFNFNLAAVQLNFDGTLARLDNPPLPAQEAATYFLFVSGSEHRSFTTVFADSHIRHIYLDNNDSPPNVFFHQFDRTGAKLAPADFLADQDPLK